MKNRSVDANTAPRVARIDQTSEFKLESGIFFPAFSCLSFSASSIGI